MEVDEDGGQGGIEGIEREGEKVRIGEHRLAGTVSLSNRFGVDNIMRGLDQEVEVSVLRCILA